MSYHAHNNCTQLHTRYPFVVEKHSVLIDLKVMKEETVNQTRKVVKSKNIYILWKRFSEDVEKCCYYSPQTTVKINERKKNHVSPNE